jgi:hypothetical protein
MLLPGDISIWARIIIIIFAIPGAILFLLGIKCVWRHKILKGSLEGIAGLLLLLIATLMVPISISLYNYDSVIEVRFWKVHEGSYEVIVSSGKGSHYLGIPGYSLQVDARILKWHGLPAQMGFKPLCRPQSSSSCCLDPYQKTKVPHTFIEPIEEQGLDLWMFVKRHDKWIPWVDAIYGSTTYMPAINGAIYNVSSNSNGLIVRPANDIARKGLDEIATGTGAYLTILEIRKECQQIKMALPTFHGKSVKLFGYSTEGGKANAYTDAEGNIRMLQVELYGESGKMIEEYYYRNGSLMFAYYVFHRYNVPYYITPEKAKEIGGEAFDHKKTKIEENRYYFNKWKMIRWLNEEGKEVDIKSVEFNAAEKEVMDFSNELILKFK